MDGSPRFPIVGVGASAGGIEALEGFFRGMPKDPGVAIIIITHLSPERESLLHEIVTRFTELNVTVARDDTTVDINIVYVLPANAILSIKEGRLSIRRPFPGQRERKPIDIFFSALAMDQDEYAAGVILSGGDSDGTLGIKAIKERGGFTAAQVADGYGPGHDDMPNSAIATGFVDFALPADKIGDKIAEFARSLASESLAGDIEQPDAANALDAARAEIYAILRNQVGHDFSHYKTKTFVRRVQRRMQVVQIKTIGDYVERLRQDAREAALLFRDLLINVTNFFRDADAFDALAATVLPKLFEGRGAEDVLRVWVPGCATGEEVYSIAILIREHMDTLSAAPRVQIFATDINERSLHAARMGRYPEPLLESVSPARRGRFFVADGGTFVVTKAVRELCIFSPHSVLRDPPFSRLDLISCRNLLIYFAGGAQSQVLPTFHHALKPSGYLFLGMSETVSQFSDMFTAVDKKHRIFRAREDAAVSFRMPTAISTVRPAASTIETKAQPRVPGNGIVLRNTIETLVLEQFSPAHVVVSRGGDVVYYSSRTGKYLEAAPGLPTRQLTSMARLGLRLELRTAFRDATETNQRVVREGLTVEGDDRRLQTVTLTIEPLAERYRDEPLFLVLFADEGPSLSREEARNRPVSGQDGATLALEQELRDTRERLQSLVEEYETALEELKSSNEELVSVNEELQSANEELEASKEELQSVNEELNTVNAELSSKVDALDHANNDLQNLFDSTDVATLFLDSHLVIRGFTPAAINVFNILPSDRGRPITDLASRLLIPNLPEQVAAVIATGERAEHRLATDDDQSHYFLRVSPYRDTEGAIDGVVIAFIDMTVHVQGERRREVMVAELQHRTRNLIAIIQSIAAQTLDKAPNLDAFTDRLKSLSRVQGLLSRSGEEPITIGALVQLELDALGTPDMTERVSIVGPKLKVRKETVHTLALALHELATNARKYGALSHGEGRLRVAWRNERDADGERLVLEWIEEGTPSSHADASRTTHRGYGRELIERALPYALKAKTSYELSDGGVRCRIDMPSPSLERRVPWSPDSK